VISQGRDQCADGAIGRRRAVQSVAKACAARPGSAGPAPRGGHYSWMITVGVVACGTGYVRDMTDLTYGALGVVERWLEAVNARNGAELARLSHERIEVVGPRGAGLMERAVLQDWLARSGFSSRPVRWFCGGHGVVVVEQVASWADAATGEPQGDLRIGSQFTVRAGRVAAYRRFDDGVGAAIAGAGLDEARDLVTTRRG
jgi:hypothetical protein